MKQEQGYLRLVQKILLEGEQRKGRNGNTKSLFGERLEFDLSLGFPLLTTKRMFWRGVVEELLWFLRGHTDANLLKEKGVSIWSGNTSREFLDNKGLTSYPEGECGPIYGYQWRAFNGDYPSKNNGVDQLKYVLTELTQNPHGRRALISAWNPTQLNNMCLPPCHVMYNFYVSSNGLCCQMYQRSSDTCTGLPFNIASTALFTSILAHVLRMSVCKIIVVIGDTHIYEEHYVSALEQVTRTPYPFPTLSINKPPPEYGCAVDDMIKWIEELQFDDMEIAGYKHHPSIKYAMVA